MTPLPPPLGPGGLRFWRLDRARHAATWDSGEGSYLAGSRWNARRVRAVYAALDPATAVLEVAVHRGFAVLDTEPHVMTSAAVEDLSAVHVVWPDDGRTRTGWCPATRLRGSRPMAPRFWPRTASSCCRAWYPPKAGT